MKKFTLYKIIALILLFAIFTGAGCNEAKSTGAENTPPQIIAPSDSVTDRVVLGKKYYSLGYGGYIENEYYTFFEDGTATYTHVMKNGNNVTFHQEINFKYVYSGEGSCVLMHNGTKMIKGEQDDAFGFSRVFQLNKDIIYWSASGENAYFVCEDYVNQLPNYAKLI